MENYKGNFFHEENIWVNEGGELAMSFNNMTAKKNCMVTLAISDLNYGIKIEEYNELNRVRTKRAIVETEQLASQLTTASWNMVINLKLAICSLLALNVELDILNAVGATQFARNLMKQPYIQARWASKNIIVV